MKTIRNSAGIFRLFDHDKPDKPGKILKFTGVVSFTAAFIAEAIIQVWDKPYQQKSALYEVIVWTGIASWVTGIFTFVALGIHYTGKEKGRNFFESTLHTLWKTFLYVLLPSIVLAALLIAWAIYTNQPAFRNI
jgi:hypothetical protein